MEGEQVFIISDEMLGGEEEGRVFGFCLCDWFYLVHGMGEHRCATGWGCRSEDHREYLALFFHVVPGIELRLSRLVINAFFSWTILLMPKIFGFKYLESEEQPRIVLGWRIGSVVKSAFCSFKRHKFCLGSRVKRLITICNSSYWGIPQPLQTPALNCTNEHRNKHAYTVTIIIIFLKKKN